MTHHRVAPDERYRRAGLAARSRNHGTYVFTNTDYNPNLWLVDVVQSTSEGGPVLGTFDKYIGDDHA